MWLDISIISCLEEVLDTSEPYVDDGLGVYEFIEETYDTPYNTFVVRNLL